MQKTALFHVGTSHYTRPIFVLWAANKYCFPENYRQSELATGHVSRRQKCIISRISKQIIVIHRSRKFPLPPNLQGLIYMFTSKLKIIMLYDKLQQLYQV